MRQGRMSYAFTLRYLPDISGTSGRALQLDAHAVYVGQQALTEHG